jgi:hypothetical protein
VAKQPKRLGRVSAEDRRLYRARLGSDLKWGRPTEPTAEVVWSLLKGWDSAVLLDDLLPRPGNGKRRAGAEYEKDARRTAKQSLVVALDCAIAVGDRGAMLTKNALFDALAQRWSRSYRRARSRGARVSYDMRPETVNRAPRMIAATMRPSIPPEVALWAFFEEHKRCGRLDAGVADERLWVACECGAQMAQPVGERR